MNKLKVDDLAWFGGEPLFDSWRPFGQLAHPEEEKYFARGDHLSFRSELA